MANDALWNLESFLDSLIVELDRAQDTLAVKGLTRRATYTVQDVALEMQIFPVYDDGTVKFANAEPGDTGASSIRLNLGSITGRQIRDIADEPPRPDDVTLETLEGIDPRTRSALRKVGVRTARDLESLRDRNVDVEEVVREKAAGASFSDLSALINRSRRSSRPPSLASAQAVVSDPRTRVEDLLLLGGNLAVDVDEGYPLAVVDDQPADVIDHGDDRIRLRLAAPLSEGRHRVAVALDPYTDITCTVVV